MRKLSRTQMRSILGGFTPLSSDCQFVVCESTAQCPEGRECKDNDGSGCKYCIKT